MLNSFSSVMSGFYLSQREVNEVLIPTIIEIPQKVAFDSKVPIIDGSFHGSFASGCKVSLHGWSSGVKDADSVGVAGPLGPEHFF